MQSDTQPTALVAVPRRRPDIRRRALIITILATATLGFAIASAQWKGPLPAVTRVSFAQLVDVTALAHGPQDAQIRTRFEQGVAMLQMRQYEYAVAAFHSVLALSPQMPEAHANMGFALLGLQQWAGAHTFFEAAIELRREQVNAYYGLALSLEALGDMPGAIGAMQTYLHRAAATDPFRERAASALQRWREQRARGDEGAAPSSLSAAAQPPSAGEAPSASHR